MLAGDVGPEIRFEAGRLLRTLAERRFAQLRAAAPNSAATLELAGASAEWSGNLDDALRHYRAAAALDPKRPGAHYRIGNILWRRREVEPALNELRQGLSLNPHHALANMRFGQTLLNTNREESAVEYLERAASAMPQSIEARRELGKAYKKAGRVAEARSAWESVAKARPDDDQVHYLLGNLYREIGHPALAKQALEIHRAILQRRRLRAEQQHQQRRFLQTRRNRAFRWQDSCALASASPACVGVRRTANLQVAESSGCLGLLKAWEDGSEGPAHAAQRL